METDINLGAYLSVIVGVLGEIIVFGNVELMLIFGCLFVVGLSGLLFEHFMIAKRNKG